MRRTGCPTNHVKLRFGSEGGVFLPPSSFGITPPNTFFRTVPEDQKSNYDF
jgi:hypothetical protein